MIKKFGLICLIVLMLSLCSCNDQSHVRDLPQLYQQTASSVVMIKDCGSGLLISNKYILTAYHVSILKSEHIIQLSNGTEILATIYAQDGFNDLALLKIDHNEIKMHKVSKLNFETEPINGEIIFSIGSPRSHYLPSGTVMMGVLSQQATQVSQTLWLCDIYLSDILCDKGSSGSPVFNLQKKLIGIIVGFHRGFTVIIPSQAIHNFLRDNKVI